VVANRWRRHSFVSTPGLARAGGGSYFVSELVLPSVLLVAALVAARLLQELKSPSRPAGAVGDADECDGPRLRFRLLPLRPRLRPGLGDDRSVARQQPSALGVLAYRGDRHGGSIRGGIAAQPQPAE